MSNQNKFKHLLRICPICLNEVGEVLHHQEFSLPDKHCLPTAYDVVACRKCGFVYADTPAHQDQYDHYYREFSKYESTSHATGGGTTELDARRIEQTVSDIVQAVPSKQGVILDIGCANGGLLAALKKHGYSNVVGIDPSPACVDYVLHQGIRAFLGGLFSHRDTTTSVDKADCIILSHVLEHVYSLREAAASVVAQLKENGTIYIEVPDASRYHSHFIVPYYYFDCEHINHFDEHSLRNLFLPFGFEHISHAKKVIFVAGNKQYPAVYAVFKKTTTKQGLFQLAFHDDVIMSVQDHIRQSQQADAYRFFDELAKTQQPIAVWGAGSHALRLLKNSALGKCNIVAFVDKDQKKQGTYLGDVQIHSPQFLLGFSGTVVICAALHNDDILAEIKHMGISAPVISAH